MHHLQILFQGSIRNERIFVLKRGFQFDRLKNWSYSIRGQTNHLTGKDEGWVSVRLVFA